MLSSANLELLYPQARTEVVTYKHGGKIIASVVLLPNAIELSLEKEMVPKILTRGEPVDSSWGIARAMESVYTKTQLSLGKVMKDTENEGI